MDWLTPIATVLAAYFGARWGLKNYIGQQWWQERKAYYAKIVSKVYFLEELAGSLEHDLYFYANIEIDYSQDVDVIDLRGDGNVIEYPPGDIFMNRSLKVMTEIEKVQKDLWSIHGEAFPYLNSTVNNIFNRESLLIQKQINKLKNILDSDSEIDFAEALNAMDQYKDTVIRLRLLIHLEMKIDLSLIPSAGLIKFKRIVNKYSEEYKKEKSKIEKAREKKLD